MARPSRMPTRAYPDAGARRLESPLEQVVGWRFGMRRCYGGLGPM